MSTPTPPFHDVYLTPGNMIWRRWKSNPNPIHVPDLANGVVVLVLSPTMTILKHFYMDTSGKVLCWADGVAEMILIYERFREEHFSATNGYVPCFIFGPQKNFVGNSMGPLWRLKKENNWDVVMGPYSSDLTMLDVWHGADITYFNFAPNGGQPKSIDWTRIVDAPDNELGLPSQPGRLRERVQKPTENDEPELEERSEDLELFSF